jgi:hypothetical protein
MGFALVHKECGIEKFLLVDPNLARISNKMFSVWDGNHQLKAWYPYIDQIH